MTGIVIINAVIPLLFTYGEHYRRPVYTNKALEWVRALPAESNSVIRGFNGLGMPAQTAADSQALLELKNQYCQSRRCLDCSIGKSILGRAL